VSAVEVFPAGNYRYIPAVFQYSSGVAAEPGYALERARFVEPLPLAEAFQAVERHLGASGRPLTAFAACELRSPAPFSEQGFRDFNKSYVVTLERWGIYRGGDSDFVNPVARTNVCPMYDAPREPVMHAFSYTVPIAAGMTANTDLVMNASAMSTAIQRMRPGSSFSFKLSQNTSVIWRFRMPSITPAL